MEGRKIYLGRSQDRPGMRSRLERELPSPPKGGFSHGSKQQRYPPSASDPELPPNWVVCTSSKGDKYYYNKETGESQWEPPHKVKDSREREKGKPKREEYSKEHHKDDRRGEWKSRSNTKDATVEKRKSRDEKDFRDDRDKRRRRESSSTSSSVSSSTSMKEKDKDIKEVKESSSRDSKEVKSSKEDESKDKSEKKESIVEEKKEEQQKAEDKISTPEQKVEEEEDYISYLRRTVTPPENPLQRALSGVEIVKEYAGQELFNHLTKLKQQMEDSSATDEQQQQEQQDQEVKMNATDELQAMYCLSCHNHVGLKTFTYIMDKELPRCKQCAQHARDEQWSKYMSKFKENDLSRDVLTFG